MFKVGDKVRCIDNDRTPTLTIGEVYEIIGSEYDNSMKETFVRLKNDTSEYVASRFEKVTESDKVNKRKHFYEDGTAIEIGDLVEVVGHSNDEYIGLHGIVERTSDLAFPISVNLGLQGVHSFGTKQLRRVLITELSNDDAQEELQNTKRYKTNSGKQLFDVLEDDLLTYDELRGFYKANIYKYTHRYKQKNGIEDLKKVKVYVDQLIKLEDKQNEI